MESRTIAQSATFGALLKRYRRAAGLSQEALAERAGYSVGHISKLERADRLPVHASVAVLADSLHLSPTERAALDYAARNPSTVSASAPSSADPARPAELQLVGRETELARLDGHLASADAPILLLVGEPGIGKTRLLREAMSRATAQSWTVLTGSCQPHSGHERCAPVVGALARYLQRLSPAQIPMVLDGCTWLDRLLPEVADLAPAPADQREVPPEHNWRLSCAAARRFLANVAGPSGTLLVLDDLHCAGADAFDLLWTLAETDAQPPLRIIGAYRSTDCDQTPLSTFLAAAAQAALVRRVPVSPLAPAAASQLLDSLLADTDTISDEMRQRIERRAGGVPFYLVSLGRMLQEDSRVQEAQALDREIPWEAAQAIRGRVRALPPAAQVLLGIAAVASDTGDTGDTGDAGTIVPRGLLVAVGEQLGIGEVALLEALTAAGSAGLLAEAEEDRYVIAPDLVREVILADLGEARRAWLHGHIARVFERRSGPASIDVAAHHFIRAGDLQQALGCWERAGDQAQDEGTLGEAAQSYRLALRLAEEVGDRTVAARMLEKLGTSLVALGDYDQARGALVRAGDMYRSRHDVAGAARVREQTAQLQRASRAQLAGLTILEPLARPLAGQGLTRDVFMLMLVMGDRRTPWYAKLVAGGSVGYVFSPVQVIPDWVPALGLLDDFVVVSLGVALAFKLTPRAVIAENRERARALLGDRASRSTGARIAAALLVGLWLMLAVLGGALLLHALHGYPKSIP